jgi:hypothetical protein
MLFLPTAREEDFKTKQVIGSFATRGADVLSTTTMICAGTTLVALGASQFAWIDVGLVLVWFAFAAAMGREFHGRRDPVEHSA